MLNISNSIVMTQYLEAKQCDSLQLFLISMHWSMFYLNLRHRWTSNSCPSSLPWHKERKPSQRIVHWKFPPPRMAAILGLVSGRGSRAFRRRLWLSTCTYITQRIHPTRKKNPLSLCGGERCRYSLYRRRQESKLTEEDRISRGERTGVQERSACSRNWAR